MICVMFNMMSLSLSLCMLSMMICGTNDDMVCMLSMMICGTNDDMVCGK